MTCATVEELFNASTIVNPLVIVLICRVLEIDVDLFVTTSIALRIVRVKRPTHQSSSCGKSGTPNS